MPEPPVLVACGHGTRSAAGRRTLAQLRLDVAAARPGLEVVTASVDVQEPSLPRTLDRLAAQHRTAVVVPLLLSAGYHVHVDVAEEVARRTGPDPLAPQVRSAAALGPDPALVDVLTDRLDEAGAASHQGVVLAAAGSSDARAVADVEQVAAALAAVRAGPVRAAYLSAASPTVADALAELGGSDGVALASYLLAPGVFQDRLAATARVVTAPLAPHPALTALVLRRYDAAVA